MLSQKAKRSENLIANEEKLEQLEICYNLIKLRVTAYIIMNEQRHQIVRKDSTYFS